MALPTTENHLTLKGPSVPGPVDLGISVLPPRENFPVELFGPGKGILPPDYMRLVPQDGRGQVDFSCNRIDLSEPIYPEFRATFESLGRGALAEELASISRDLFDLPELERLSGVRQMSAFYTRLGQDSYFHDRLTHSLDVANYAAFTGLMSSADSDVVKLLFLAGLLHDIGHPPFSHTAENFLGTLGSDAFESIGYRGAFHHEKFGWHRITTGPVAEVLLSHGIPPALIVDILSSEGKPGNLNGVIDWSDRCSYVLRDQMLSDQLSPMERHALESDMQQFLERLRIVSQGPTDIVFEGGADIAESILKGRMRLLERVSLRPETLLANRIIEAEIAFGLTHGIFTPSEFVSFTDEEAIAKFRPKAQQALREGVENHFVRVEGFCIEDLKENIRRKASDRIVQNGSAVESGGVPLGSRLEAELMATLRLRDNGTGSPVIVPMTHRESKEVSYHTIDDSGRTIRHYHLAEVAPANQGISVWVSNEAPVSLDQVQQRVQEYFSPDVAPPLKRRSYYPF